jgi:hypothetical protein
MSISNIEIEKYKTVLRNITDLKKNCLYINDIILNLKNSISESTNIEFSEIENKVNNKKYFSVDHNPEADYFIRILKRILLESKGLDIYDKYLFLIYPDGEQIDFYPEIEIDVDNLNRIHIPIGLPYILKGLGLGKKIYKSLIYKLNYISTTVMDRSMDAVFIWDSLRKDDKIFTFVRNESILCVSPTVDFLGIEEILIKFYDNLLDEDIILDDDFKNKYLADIRKSNKISFLIEK